MRPLAAEDPRHLTLFVKDTGMGGAEVSLLALLSELRSRSWGTSVVAHRQGRMFDRFRDATDRQLVLSFPYPRQPASWLRLLPFRWRVRGFIARHNPDILLSGDFYTLWAALFFRSARTPVFSLWQGEYRFDDDSCARKWLQYGGGQADRLLASEPVAQHANETKLLPREVEVLNPRVDENRFDPTGFDRDLLRHSFGWEPQQHIALCVGRIGEGKGQLWLAERFLDEPQFPKSARLVIVGPGENSKLMDLASKSGQRISLLGSRDDVPELLAACDLAIQPGTLQESFGLAALEAVLMNKLVLAFRSGALPYTLGADYPGFCVSHDKTELISRWLDHARHTVRQLNLPQRKNIVARFGHATWARQIGQITPVRF